jgi:protein SSD1
LDDALHISKNEDGTGAHIADVTHFVKPGTALDREARKRATTVYLVQQAVPMLPPTLSEHLCSLSPGQDQLTFSAVFKMTPQGRVIDTWFGKSIICSSAKLTYDSVQQVLSNVPEDCSVVLGDEAKQLIEEFMLLANSAVAKKVAAGLPEQAMLRRHEAPIDRRLEGFAKRAAKMGFEVDTSSASSPRPSHPEPQRTRPTATLGRQALSDHQHDNCNARAHDQ